MLPYLIHLVSSLTLQTIYQIHWTNEQRSTLSTRDADGYLSLIQTALAETLVHHHEGHHQRHAFAFSHGQAQIALACLDAAAAAATTLS